MDRLNNSRDIFVKKVLEAIPPQIKPIDYLMEILDLSRVSIYRRVNSQIPFSYDEMVRLSSDLEFSLEDIIPPKENNRAVFHFQEYKGINTDDFFLKILQSYHDIVMEETKCKNRYSILTMNNLWPIFACGYNNLLKFFYYKWLHSTYSIPFDTSLGKISIPEPILAISNKIKPAIQSLNNTVYILDKNILLNTMTEIQYYFRRKLIPTSEMALLISDIKYFIDHSKKNVLSGKTEKGTKITYYLSFFNILSNSIYISLDNKPESFFYEYSIHPLKTNNINICSHHKDWLESLKKYSVLISASNEAVQLDYFEKQIEYLNNLKDDKDLF